MPKALAEIVLHQFLPLSGFLGPVCCDWGRGGAGMTPACPSSRATGSDGCAPTDIQYLQRHNACHTVQVEGMLCKVWESWLQNS